MEEKNMNEVLFGADFAAKMKTFQDGLQKIEEKYIAYFSNRKGKYLSDKNDHLYYHYIIQNDAHQITFGFLNDSDLDESIKTECITLFNTIYKK